MPDSAAQSQSANACCRNDSARSSQPEHMRSMIHIAPDASAADCDSASRRIDSRVLDRRKINHETVITNSQSTCIVTAAADGDEQIVISGEVH